MEGKGRNKMPIVSHYVSIDVSHLVSQLSVSDQWEILGLLWENLDEYGTEQDWVSFCEDYSITRKE